PDTESRGPVILRARVEDARDLLGMRTEIAWDATRFTLQEGSVTATRQNMALFHEIGTGVLKIELALLNGAMTGGGQLFSFTLTPLDPPALVGVAGVTEFASRRSGQLVFEHQSLTEGPGTVTPSAAEPVAVPDGDADEEPAGEPVDEVDAPAEDDQEAP